MATVIPGLASMTWPPSQNPIESALSAVTDGSFLEAEEYVGGFWILGCANMDEGVAWARKACVPAGRRSRSVPFSKSRPSNGKKIFATL
jgi:hypothetical protein